MSIFGLETRPLVRLVKERPIFVVFALSARAQPTSRCTKRQSASLFCRCDFRAYSSPFRVPISELSTVADSTDSEADEAERRELSRIEQLLTSTPAYRLVCMCKRGEWAIVRELLVSDAPLDLTLSDSVGEGARLAVGKHRRRSERLQSARLRDSRLANRDRRDVDRQRRRFVRSNEGKSCSQSAFKRTNRCRIIEASFMSPLATQTRRRSFGCWRRSSTARERRGSVLRRHD